jgi:hypothetical protein
VTNRRWSALVAVLLVCLPATAVAQTSGNWNQSHDPYVAAIGLAAGLTSGSGLAVRWPALPQTMMSVAGGVWGGGDDLAWNVGAEAHLILRQVTRTRFFAGPAVGLYSDHKDQKTNVNLSLGVGVEYLVWPRVSAKFDLGFTYLSDSQKVYPLPQVALFFYF